MAESGKSLDFTVTVIGLFAVIALGLSAGALLAEGAVLVPYWRSLSPDAFLAWYGENAPLLYGFYSRLEIGAAVLAVVAAVSFRLLRRSGAGWLALAAILAVAVLAAFPLYFRDVNASFTAGTAELDQLADELARWAAWHWSRTLIGVGAFVAAVLGFRQR